MDRDEIAEMTEYLYQAVESWEAIDSEYPEDDDCQRIIGVEIAYLCYCILQETFVELASESLVRKLLKARYPEGHKIWKHIYGGRNY